jgi:AraC-like DNA-binding protein
MDDRRRPLDAFPLIRTHDLDVLRAGLSQLFSDPRFDIGPRSGALDGWVNYRPLQTIGLQYGRYGAAIRADFGDVKYFVQGITVSGRGEQVTNRSTSAVDPTRAGILSPGDRIGLNFDAGFEHLALIIEPTILAAKLSALIGTPLKNPLRFQGESDFSRPASKHLLRLTQFLAEELSSPELRMPPAVLTEWEQLLMVWILQGSSHNYSHLLDGEPRSVAPWQVRRVENYIEANWDQPLTVEAFALATGASVRSIFHSFKESRGYSPMIFLKQIRLKRARDMLQNPTASTSVTSVAYACSFNNLGHFAKDYLQVFGERPSETLNYAKGARRPKSAR